MEKDYGLLSKKELEGLTKEELLEAKKYFEQERAYNRELIDDKDYKDKTELYNDIDDENTRIQIINNLLDDGRTLK